MKRVPCVACLVAALLLPAHTQAQMIGPWFNGVGVSGGGGPLRFEGGPDDALVGLIRPEDDTLGAGAFGFLLSAGTPRWALMVPELHDFPASVSTDGVTGTLTVGTRTLAFAPASQSVSAFAIPFGIQGSPVSSICRSSTCPAWSRTGARPNCSVRLANSAPGLSISPLERCSGSGCFAWRITGTRCCLYCTT